MLITTCGLGYGQLHFRRYNGGSGGREPPKEERAFAQSSIGSPPLTAVERERSKMFREAVYGFLSFKIWFLCCGPTSKMSMLTLHPSFREARLGLWDLRKLAAFWNFECDAWEWEPKFLLLHLFCCGVEWGWASSFSWFLIFLIFKAESVHMFVFFAKSLLSSYHRNKRNKTWRQIYSYD